MPIPRNITSYERISAKSLVLNQLQEWIVEGVLKPNEKINDGEIAQALGVSRTPVREALQVLKFSGLVEMIPGKQTKISPINLEDIPKIYETLAALHTLVGKQAIINIKENDIRNLKLLNNKLKDAIDIKDSKRAIELDLQFHNVLVKAANNIYIEPILNYLHLHILRFNYLFVKKFIPASSSFEEHVGIIKSLENNNFESMEIWMSQNWSTPMSYFRNNNASSNKVSQLTSYV
ncbi:GntR family transcriptional regulator [Bacillus thuringiensis]|uniref:GntR family transcriptional regulator n=1 Tax=Bacillus thuringiensis TaxID=1428 RepID=UPI000BF95A28|nr:GntR family transcriptional regulator [Bacillus thuringiensis]PES33304.1 GntR family transcriptional regulator [Bacillus thuringiensis]